MRSTVLAATAVAATLLVPGAAHAAPAPTTGLLGTYGFGRAEVIAAAGQAAGLWTGARVRHGFAGDDLIVTYRPRSAAAETETQVYTALFNEVADPSGECERVGADGVDRKVWTAFRCRTGIAPNYTLLVR
ncbi:hypothetical protein [Nucisporomicrobium flavum]|uniref:hypothetical protein n=1 Tax=Nucisporomicrobium flavum TaxID=2785915 RepID=UPI0018F74FCB|nr:hypothetical protein [Nucisporomicrobium flavum]